MALSKTNPFPFFTSVVVNWRSAWKQPSFRIQLVICILLIISFGFFFPFFFDYIESRDGERLNDFILNRIPPKDVSWMVFLLLYLGICIGMLCNLVKPKNFLIAMEVYCIVTMLRILSILLIPLNPPFGYIPLKEPFVALFINGTRIISKDLFFSGHASTIVTIYFSVEQRHFKNIILIFSIMVGTLLLVQHVHYTIDVIVAPVAVFFCYLLSKKVFTKDIL